MIVAVVLVVLLGVGLGLALCRRGRHRGFVVLHPDQRRWLRSLRLTEPEQFFELEALIVSGHPDRNVVRLLLGSGEQQRLVYLKRESRIRFGTRLLNFLSGFGWVAGPVREAQMLGALQREGLPAPRWLAAGEDRSGRAFLLVEDLPGTVSLMSALQDRPGFREQRALAARLGRTLAAIHRAGFFHRDLYGKHVLVGSADGELSLLDWQRARRRAWLSSSEIIRDLACLHATLPDELAGPRERLACLRAYLDSSGKPSELRWWLSRVESAAARLRKRRHIREKRQLPRSEKQEWIRLDGQGLCVTPALVELAEEQSLDWLRLERQPLPANAISDSRSLRLPGGEAVLLRQKSSVGLLQHWRGKLTRRSPVSPVLRQAMLLWRLERHGVPVGRVLAIGEHRDGRQADSLLLYQPLDSLCPLTEWLTEPANPHAEKLLYQAGALLARLHEACCYLEQPDALVVRVDPQTRELVLGLSPTIGGVVLERRPNQARAWRDRLELRRQLSMALGDGSSHWLHFERGYGSTSTSVGRFFKPSLRDPRDEKRRFEKPSYEQASPRDTGSATSFWQRLTRGCHRLLQRPDWESFIGSSWPESIMQAEVTDGFLAKQGRSTGRWVLHSPEGRRLVVYLKRYYRLPFWRGWLAALWPSVDWSPAMQEYRRLCWLGSQGVPVPAAVATGEFIGPWGKLQGMLAVEELTDMLPLPQAIPLAAETLPADVFRWWKAGLVKELARLTRLLHDRRHFHKDLYLCHFFIRRTDVERPPEAWRKRVVLIDLHRLGHHPRTWRWWRLKDLAQLLYSSEIGGIEARDRIAFWKHYREPGVTSRRSRWLRWLVGLKWSRYRSLNRRKRRKDEG
jgi:heptose I phosphotransferase